MKSDINQCEACSRCHFVSYDVAKFSQATTMQYRTKERIMVAGPGSLLSSVYVKNTFGFHGSSQWPENPVAIAKVRKSRDKFRYYFFTMFVTDSECLSMALASSLFPPAFCLKKKARSRRGTSRMIGKRNECEIGISMKQTLTTSLMIKTMLFLSFHLRINARCSGRG